MDNSLISEADLKQFYAQFGERTFEDTFVLNARRSGKTTALAFLAIGKAMQSPGKTFVVKDHFHNNRGILAWAISNIVRDLNLKGFKVTEKPKETITFNLYEKSPEKFLKERA